MYPGVRVQSVSSAVCTSPLQSVSAVGQRSGHIASAHNASGFQARLPEPAFGRRRRRRHDDGNDDHDDDDDEDQDEDDYRGRQRRRRRRRRLTTTTTEDDDD